MADETDSRKKTRDQLLEFQKVYADKLLHYKTSCRRNKRRLHVLTILSRVMTTVGVIVGEITMNPIVLGIISGIGVVIQGLLKLKNYEKKIEACRLAQGRYQHVLNQIESFFRGESYDPVVFTHKLHWVDDLIADFCLSVEKLNGSSRG